MPMPRPIALATAGLVLAVATAPASAITIQFDYSYDSNNFFSSQARKDTLEAAGSFFETHITDDLTAISSGGVNHFNAQFYRPDDGSVETINDYSVAADTLTVFVGGRNFGGSILGEGGFGGWSASGTQAFIDNIRTRGESSDPDDVAGATATEFAPWGGSISFDTDSTWYFDADVGTTEAFSGNDFYSVAVHELAHVLGIGTADSWDNLVNGSDQFTGANAVAEYGGLVDVMADWAHWDEGTQSTVYGTAIAQEAAMDPTLTVGTRKYMTDLDMAGLDDIGWDVAASSEGGSQVPLPSSLLLLGAGLLGAGLRMRRRRA